MQMPSRVLGFLLFASLATSAFASQEGTLPFSTFNLATADAPPSGPVVVSGKQAFSGIIQLDALAFGRRFSLGEEQLKLLAGFSANGAQLSFATGRAPEGRQLYLVLSTGFSSGPAERKLITFTEDGSVTVSSLP